MERSSYHHPCIVLDIDGTICPTRQKDQQYDDLPIISDVVDTLREYREQGYYIILYTGRQMRTYDGNVGKITAFTVPVLTEWLESQKIPFDELHIGRPWPGFNGFYVCDQTIRPDEFVRLSRDEIKELIGK